MATLAYVYFVTLTKDDVFFPLTAFNNIESKGKLKCRF